MRNIIRVLRGKPVQLSPKQEAKMARMQAKADAQFAAAKERERAAQEENAAIFARLGGAASFGGPSAAPRAAPQAPRSLGDMREILKQSVESFKDVVGEGFDNRAGVIDPGPGADLNRPRPEAEDPVERAAIAAAERAARDAARAAFNAPAPPIVAFTRFATTGRTQLDDVAARLRALAPEHVFGVYRVPDRFDHNRNAEGRAFLEWEIVHRPDAPAVSEEVLTTAFRRDAHWVARSPGEASVLDEDQEGRARWRAYQHEVLHARLDHRTDVRPPIEVDDHPRQSFLSEVFDTVNPLDPHAGFPQLFNRNERPSLGPYCGTLP